MDANPKLSVVVPCYNEAQNIPLILERFGRALQKRNDVEVILVDNNSSDNSGEVFQKLAPRYPFAKVLFEREVGYGAAVLCGLRAGRGICLGWTHADLQTDPADVVRALELFEREVGPQNLYVKGKRRGRSLFDLFFTVGMGVFETLYLHRFLWDINAQPNVFPKEFFASWNDPPKDFSLDLYALYLARKQHMRLVRFPVRFPKRMHGVSSWNTGLAAKWKFIKRTFKFSAGLKKRLASSR